MINLNNLKIFPFSYPILKSDNLLDDKFYNNLKSNWPNFKKFNTTSAGQVSRNNIEIIKNNENYKKIHEDYRKLYDIFDSKEFRTFLHKSFELDNAKKKGFIGNFDNSKLVMHIAEAKDGYENPWHVDTRGRIIHFLIYFGDELIKEGGELGISEHKLLDNYLDYKQYPNIKNLKNIQYIKPKDNVGLFILSQNNSYHKGCATKGYRKFIYAGYTNINGEAWETNKWNCNRNFSQQLHHQKLQ